MIIKNDIVEKELHKEHILYILAVFPTVFLIFGVVMAFIEKDFIHNYVSILSSPALLLTDFFEVGGLGASFINAAIIAFFNLYLLKRFKMKVNGLIIAAFMTVLGFSFFGKNVVNIIPIYIGGYIFAKNQNKKFKEIIVIIMFATGLSPIISQLMFTNILPRPFNIICGVGLGILIGFVMAPLSAQMLKFHEGYSLYNIGFTAGIIGTVITSFFRAFNLEISPVNIVYKRYDLHVKIVLILLFLYLMGVGIYIYRNSIYNYKSMFRYSGRTATDFTFLVGYGTTFLNMGLLGLLFTILVIVLGSPVNGPVLAGIFTVVGFSAFGKHIKNCYPPVLGVVLMALLLGLDMSSTSVILAVLFSTTIAPIAGKFGPFWGIVSGVMHLVVVFNIGMVHGGVNLYNNGFSGGVVAGVLVPIIDSLKRSN